MRVLLLATNKEVEPYPTYPLGMSVLATALQAHGHEVHQVDMLSAAATQGASLSATLQDFAPHVVGISVRNIDNVDMLTSEAHWALDDVKDIVHTIRKILPGVPVLLGGPAVSIMPQAIGEYCQADCAVAGEGEQTMPALLQAIAEGKPLPPVVFPCAALPGSAIAAPSFDPALLHYYATTSGVVNLHTKRGCPNLCLYCSYPTLEGRCIRAREPEAVIEDIRRLQATTSFAELFFTDAVFNDAEGHWLRLVEAMARQNVVVPWTAFFQPAGLEPLWQPAGRQLPD